MVRDDDESGNVTVYVTARRSVLDKLTSADITVSANMQNMTLQDTVPYEVTVPGVKREKCPVFSRGHAFRAGGQERKDLCDLLEHQRSACQRL
ncbi:MAG: CdaR family protein [Lachnospiraceae bacterium]